MSSDTPSEPRNDRTMVLVPPVPGTGWRSTAETFRYAWSRIRPLMQSPEHEYVLALASALTDEVHGLGVSIDSSGPRDVIVGRHDRCDIQLTSDRGVALRHALVRFTSADDGAPTVRVVDLRTELGLRDTDGEVCTGALSDGCLFLRLGSFLLMAIRNQDIRWPRGARKAWSALPEEARVETSPVHLDASRALRIRPRLRVLLEGEDSCISHVMHVESSICLSAAERESDRAIGSIHFDEDGMGNIVRLSPRALSRGVLVGRYERCQVETMGLVGSKTVSRVHLCLLLDETGLWAIDTASTNGSTIDGKRFRTTRIGRHAALGLGGSVTARWQAS